MRLLISKLFACRKNVVVVGLHKRCGDLPMNAELGTGGVDVISAHVSETLYSAVAVGLADARVPEGMGIRIFGVADIRTEL